MLSGQLKMAGMLSVALATTLACGQIADAGEVVGGGTREVDLGQGAWETHRVGLTAREIENGMVQGQFQFSVYDFIGFYFTSHLEVDCVHFLDEKTVIVGATVVYDTDPNFIGTTAVIIVRDNGEGYNDPPDETSDVFYSRNFGSELNCETAAALLETEYDVEQLLMPIDTGNIQVRP